MGFRFRRSIRLAPSLRLNLGRTGVSATLGGRGISVNVGRQGVQGTVGLPGSGLSYSRRLGRGGAGPRRGLRLLAVAIGLIALGVWLAG
ncbi:DUF4236 domain-containing protein [Rubellimicrobium arenae]|uniref:DUF4236 domain-containing protein n=1 Tax=Rubellimicrobium arenae TaxID=2817372 RepID=UPI001B301677|nr:DUF4236 domain-containing protein [Rubellimicrobium arenae]